MKLLLFLLLPLTSLCQFHVAVEANPDNHGETNVAWKNNYIITYTVDDWKTKTIIKAQLTYSGIDDNGITYYTSYYEKITFEKKADAIAFAKQFKNIELVKKYDVSELAKHNRLKLKWDTDNKKLCFGCKDRKNEKPKPIIVH